MTKSTLLFSLCALCLGASAVAAPATYEMDPEHTYPSFEADHMGISVWRGRFNKTSGKVLLDKAAGTGTVEVSIDTASIDFGHAKVAEYVAGPEQLDAARYPTITYKGRLGGFRNGAPTTVTGELTMHGVTKPVSLKINSFKCIPHPMLKRDYCGADVSGSFKRDAFGLDYQPQWGFKPDVTLRIQVEALKAE